MKSFYSNVPSVHTQINIQIYFMSEISFNALLWFFLPVLGRKCENMIDYCARSVCENGGTCVNYLGFRECRCPVGYSGNDCEITPCDAQPCAQNSTILCTPRHGGYSCSCRHGFTGKYCEISKCYCSTVELKCIRKEKHKFDKKCWLSLEVGEIYNPVQNSGNFLRFFKLSC